MKLLILAFLIIGFGQIAIADDIPQITAVTQNGDLETSITAADIGPAPVLISTESWASTLKLEQRLVTSKSGVQEGDFQQLTLRLKSAASATETWQKADVEVFKVAYNDVKKPEAAEQALDGAEKPDDKVATQTAVIRRPAAMLTIEPVGNFSYQPDASASAE